MVKDVQRSFNPMLFTQGPAKTRQYIAQFSGRRNISRFLIVIIYTAWSLYAASFNSSASSRISKGQGYQGFLKTALISTPNSRVESN
jgi:hypothetical protein